MNSPRLSLSSVNSLGLSSRVTDVNVYSLIVFRISYLVFPMGQVVFDSSTCLASITMSILEPEIQSFISSFGAQIRSFVEFLQGYNLIVREAAVFHAKGSPRIKRLSSSTHIAVLANLPYAVLRVR